MLGGIDGGEVTAVDLSGTLADVDISLGAVDGDVDNVAVLQVDGACYACRDVYAAVGIEGDVGTARYGNDPLHDGWFYGC